MPGIKRNLLYNFILSASQVLFPIISIPYISRVLDPSGLGRVSFIDSFTYYFIVIAEAGITAYGIREVARSRNEPGKLKSLVSDLMKFHLVTSLAALCLYFIFIGLVYSRVNDTRLLWFSVSFILVNAFNCEWYFWGREKFGYITLRSLIIRLLGLASIFVLVRGEGDYYLYYGIMVLSSIATLIWNLVIVFREVPINLSSRSWKAHFPKTLIMYGVSITYSVMLMLDSVILGLAVSATAVSFYALAVRIVRMATSFITDPLLVLYPNMVSRLASKDNEGFSKIVSASFQLVLLVTIPLGTGIYLLSDAFTDMYLGEAFFPVSSCLKILAFYPLIKSFGLFLNKQILMPFNEERLVLRSLLITILIFIPLAFILSYFYSFEGACIALVIAEILNSTMNYLYAKKVSPGIKSIDLKNIYHAVLGSVLFIPIVLVINNYITDPLINVILSFVSCLGVYFLCVVLVLKNNILLSLLQEIRNIGKEKK